MAKLDKFESSTLQKPTLALHVFSDTLSDQGDFDSEITTDYRHLRPQDTRYGIDDCMTKGAYGVELIDQLAGNVREEIRKAKSKAGITGRLLGKVHPNVREADKALKDRTIRVVANSAPRTGSEHTNGKNFYLAITENGVEVYATPLEVLTYIREKVVSLFEIPNEGHPVFRGDKEQFRSSIIGRSGEYPEHLRRVDPSIIPEQKNPLEIAYVDEFGNIRLRAKNNGQIKQAIEESQEEGQIRLTIAGIAEGVRAHIVTCLDEIPDGEWGFYQNVADGQQKDDKPGYWELVRKWENPHTRINGHETIGKPKIGSLVGMTGFEPVTSVV